MQTLPTLSLTCCSLMMAFGVGSQPAGAAHVRRSGDPRLRIAVVTSLQTGGVALLSISILMKPRLPPAHGSARRVQRTGRDHSIDCRRDRQSRASCELVVRRAVVTGAVECILPSPACSQKTPGANAAWRSPLGVWSTAPTPIAVWAADVSVAAGTLRIAPGRYAGRARCTSPSVDPRIRSRYSP